MYLVKDLQNKIETVDNSIKTFIENNKEFLQFAFKHFINTNCYLEDVYCFISARENEFHMGFNVGSGVYGAIRISPDFSFKIESGQTNGNIKIIQTYYFIYEIATLIAEKRFTTEELYAYEKSSNADDFYFNRIFANIFLNSSAGVSKVIILSKAYDYGENSYYYEFECNNYKVRIRVHEVKDNYNYNYILDEFNATHKYSKKVIQLGEIGKQIHKFDLLGSLD